MPDNFANPWDEGGQYWASNAVQTNALNYERPQVADSSKEEALPRSVSDVTAAILPGDILEYLRRLVNFKDQENPIRKLEDLFEELRNIRTPVIPGEDLTQGEWSGLLKAWFLETSPALSQSTWIGDKVEFSDQSLYSIDIMNSVSYAAMRRAFFKVADADRPNPFPSGFSFSGPDTATENFYSAVEWFIGSYDTKIYWNIDSQTGEYRVTMMITNKSHWYSGTRLPKSYQDIIEKRFGIKLTNLVDSAPRGQTIRRKMPARLLSILDYFGVEVPSFGGNMYQQYDISDVWTKP